MTTRTSYLRRKDSATFLLSLLMIANLFSASCASNGPSTAGERRVAEATPQAPPAQAAATVPVVAPESAAEETAELPSPRLEDAREAVARVYRDAVTVDMRRQPAYVVGDFNGDGSEDIAVVVRPATKDRLSEINDEVANWILEDPRQVQLPDPHKSVQALPPDSRPVVKPND